MTVLTRSVRRSFTCVSWLLTALACPAFAAYSVTPCLDVFDNGASGHAADLKITFERDAQLLNAPTSLLNFSNVKKDNKSSQLTCDSVDCSAGGTVSETLDPGPFQATTSTTDFTEPDDGITLTQAAYDRVTVESGTTLNVDPTITEYFFNDLEVESNATIVLQPGDYWIDDLALKQGTQLQVGGSGTARIYVNTVNKFGGAVTNADFG